MGQKVYKVYISAGHGGSDPGACANGLKEKDAALVIALACRDYLTKHGVLVKMNRTTDKTSLINSKVAAANAWDADFVIDIHLNAGGGIGIEVYYSAYGNKKGKALAKAVIASALKNSLQTTSRGIKTKTENGTDYFGMIRMTNAPAIIVECAFLDNKTDCKKVNTVAKQRQMGEAIAKGFLNYAGIKWSDETVPNASTGNETGATAALPFAVGTTVYAAEDVTLYSNAGYDNAAKLTLKGSTACIVSKYHNANGLYMALKHAVTGNYFSSAWSKEFTKFTKDMPQETSESDTSEAEIKLAKAKALAEEIAKL